MAVLRIARPGAENICGAPTPGKKSGPNITFAFSLQRACTTQIFAKSEHKFISNVVLMLLQCFRLCVYFIKGENFSIL